MKKLALLPLLLSSSCLAAPNAANVQQSGTVTPTHVAAWATSGIVQDGGTSQNGFLSTVGITASNPCSFGINSAKAPNPSTQLCFGVVAGQYALISLDTFSAPAVPLKFRINGTFYTFPFSIGGIVGPDTSVVGDIACWNNTVGTLLADCKGFDIPYSPSYQTSPTGNPTGGLIATTYSTGAIQGTTTKASNREFLLNIGLTSNTGSAAINSNGDKVGLYVGSVGQAGTGDLWATNFLIAQNAGSGSYNAQGIEMDVNNFNADKGGSDGPSGLPAKVTYALSISGVGDSNNYTNTAAISMISFGGAAGMTPLYAHGLISNGFYKFNVLADYSQSPTYAALFGGYNYGVDFKSGVFSKASIRLSNEFNGGIVTRNMADSADIKLLRADGVNGLICESGCGGLFVGSVLVPSVSGSFDLGAPSAVWKDLFAQTGNFGTTSNIATITDGGTLAVGGDAAFDAAVAFASAVQFTGLTHGSPVKYACFDSVGFLVASTSPC
jgi:hypothetical protein